MDVTELDGRAYAKFVTAGSYFLRKYRQVLNDLNVFPVPDGDTGTNMYLTARQAALEAAKVRASPLSDVAAAAARGALMGARGNSGVIISQMLRGFAHHVRHRERIDTFVLGTAMREAVAAARQALVQPVEGTIVTVAEAAADAAYRLALHEKDFYRLTNAVVRAANDALERTPEQLPILKEAGVVDAGGAGFVYFLEGGLRFLPENKVRATAFPRRPVRGRVFTPQQRVDDRKFCTEFLLERATCSTRELRELLSGRCDSLIVAGDEAAIKVHLHTDDPKGMQMLASRHGSVTRLKIDDMQEQHNLLVVDRPQFAYSVVALVPGPGFEQIVKELGAEIAIVAPNNPSVAELLLAFNKALAPVVFFFANDKNAVLAAREAARESAKTVHVIPTTDVVEGVAALFALRSAPDSMPGPEAVLAAARRPRSAQVFFAGRDATVGGTTVKRGRPVAKSQGQLHAGETPALAARAALEAMGANDGGLITVYYGGAQKERDAQRLADELQAAFPSADAEYYYGGQRDCEYWISLDD